MQTKTIQIKWSDIQFITIAAMIFAVLEVLSIFFNPFFYNINLLGYKFNFNLSVTFFCLSFFIIDIVTEIYNEKVAKAFVYGKIISQLVFIVLGVLAINILDIKDNFFTQVFYAVPLTVLYSMIASYIGYTITYKIMAYLKARYEGRFLFSRYLGSTIPGEIAFSLIFSLLSFSHHRSLWQVINIFSDLIIVKFILSFIFGVLICPLTLRLKQHFGSMEQEEMKDFSFHIQS